MTYDEIHNITRKNQRAFRKSRTSGAETPNTPLTYNAAYTYGNAAKPHSVTRKRGCGVGIRSASKVPDAGHAFVRLPVRRQRQPGRLQPDQLRRHAPDDLGFGALGATSAVTDRVGQVWQNITYFPFGEEWVQEGTA